VQGHTGKHRCGVEGGSDDLEEQLPPLAYSLGTGDDCPTLQGVTVPPPAVINMPSGVISVDSVSGVFLRVGQLRSRSSIASEVGETQLRDAASKRTKMSEM